MHLFGFPIRIYHDAPSPERQNIDTVITKMPSAALINSRTTVVHHKYIRLYFTSIKQLSQLYYDGIMVN